jgi:hypothetical protein
MVLDLAVVAGPAEDLVVVIVVQLHRKRQERMAGIKKNLDIYHIGKMVNKLDRNSKVL